MPTIVAPVKAGSQPPGERFRTRRARVARRGGGEGSPGPYDAAIEEIRTERLIVRALRRGDLPAFVAYRREPSIARFQSWEATYSMLDGERLIAEQGDVEFGQPGPWLQLGLEDRRAGSLVGDCAVRVMSAPPRTAEIGVTLAPESHGRGLAREAVQAVVTILFDHHRLDRIVAEVDERNRPAQRLFEHLGFRLEARLLDADWFKGAWATLRIYAVLESEWTTAAAR